MVTLVSDQVVEFRDTVMSSTANVGNLIGRLAVLALCSADLGDGLKGRDGGSTTILVVGA